MESVSINIIRFVNKKRLKASPVDTIDVTQFSDLQTQAKEAFIKLEIIEENDKFNLYSPQMRKFVTAGNFNTFLDLSKIVDSVVIYCYRFNKDTEWDEDQERLDNQYKLDDWNYAQFLEYLQKVSFTCSPKCTNSTTNISKSLYSTIDDEYSFELMNKFENAFKKFKKHIKEKMSSKRLLPITIPGYSNVEKAIQITGHEVLCKKLMNVLDSALAALFPDISVKLNFIPRPNKAEEYSDLYYESSNVLNEVTFSKLIAEVKTRKKVDFNVPNIIEDHLFEAIYQTAGQLLDAKSSPKVVLLTCHEYSYFLYMRDESNIIQISPIIQRKDFFHAVLLVLSLSYKPISQALDFNLGEFTAQFTNRTNQNEAMQPRNSTRRSDHNQSAPANHQYGLRSNSGPSTKDAESVFDHSGDSGIQLDDEYSSGLFTTKEFIKARRDRIFLGYGRCGIVSRFEFNDRFYADKSCSIFKSKKGVLEELRNEFEILRRLNSKVQSDKRFFPGVYFYGPTFVTMHIVMDFIEGQQIEDFNDKSVTFEVKKQCLQRVEELHAIRLLHGDLRAPNFILTLSGVFIIDSGRSRFVETSQENELELEMANFRRLLNVLS